MNWLTLSVPMFLNWVRINVNILNCEKIARKAIKSSPELEKLFALRDVIIVYQHLSRNTKFTIETLNQTPLIYFTNMIPAIEIEFTRFFVFDTKFGIAKIVK